MNKIKDNFKCFVEDILTFRYPRVEQGAFLLFFFCLAFLSLTGFFFTLFIKRGLHGYFLLSHVAAGGLFALTLAILVVLRARAFSSSGIWKQTKKSPRKKENEVSINRIQAAAAWLVVCSGLSQVLSAFILMMPFFSTEVNLGITALHRWSGLIVLLSAAVYTYFSLAESGRKKK